MLFRSEIKDGKIFKTTVTGIIPSTDGTPGEKKAKYNPEDIEGTVNENTTQGIFGTYNGEIPNQKKYKVITPNEVKTGNAKILTVLNGKDIKEYDIKINQIIDLRSNNKNFIFEITDEELKSKTGGIIQGMSGSPIIQNGKFVGAVTHVLVNNPQEGYAVFGDMMIKQSKEVS